MIMLQIATYTAMYIYMISIVWVARMVEFLNMAMVNKRLGQYQRFLHEKLKK